MGCVHDLYLSFFHTLAGSKLTELLAVQNADGLSKDLRRFGCGKQPGADQYIGVDDDVGRLSFH